MAGETVAFPLLYDPALCFAEDQIFQPQRDEFDYLIDRTLLADMGSYPNTRTPTSASTMWAGLRSFWQASTRLRVSLVGGLGNLPGRFWPDWQESGA